MMTDSEVFFIQEFTAYAKTLPLVDCNRFLSGMIYSLGE
jgi:hypothetical protein